ncbi:hypothetical protein LXA43DRAFT_955852 [Ganoderma leucocontextum]|nr:hypothetical protein LXA43DRAFT_955852 [Ganoderma leucocontextum]
MSWAAPFSFNYALWRSLRLGSHSEPIHKHVASCNWRLYANLPLKRRFATSETSEQDPPTPEATPETPTVVRTPITRPRRRIRTLNPARLTPDDYLDFSSRGDPTFGVVLPFTERPAYRPRLFATQSEWSSGVFPPDTHGFLYYHVPPNSPPLAGELRFRLTSSRDPSSFAAASDLLTEQGMPWSYPLWKLLCREECREITSLLVQDGLVSQRTLTVAAEGAALLRRGPTMTGESSKKISKSPVLSSFGQEFDFRYGMGGARLYLLAGRDAIVKQSFRWTVLFQVRIDGKIVHYCPFEGPVVCCFERSKLPEHTGKRVAVMRVVRVLDNDPIRHVPAPDGKVYPIKELRPRQGELVKTMCHGQVRPWAVDVDKEWKRTMTVGKALRVLFENEELYGSPRESDV